ncbi:MAG: SAM-dependent chlorinase/fluorinase [Bacteroidetes bacterium]|nr:SAM-dependent chlorinase/fluorinase [Bacteroidota bacterium]
MAIITLTTDLGLKDYYVSLIKAAILSQEPEATIVDISHDVPKFDLLQASFIIKNSYSAFPEGSIHIVGIDADLKEDRCHLALKVNGHYFIGADNGIFSLIFDKVPDEIVEISLNQDVNYFTFPTKDVFVPAACHIARGGTLEMLGRKKESLTEMIMLMATSDKNMIRGNVIYIDDYENVICNITIDMFNDIGKERRFTIYFRRTEYKITVISNTYSDVIDGEMCALFGSTGHLEIAINKGVHGAGGGASSLLGLAQGDTIRVEFAGE